MTKHLLVLVVATCAMSSAPAQSLWNPKTCSGPLFADPVARQVGDLLTIVIAESQRVQNREQTQLDKDNSLDAALTNFDVLPNAFNIFPAVSGTATRSMTGEARYDKQGSFETQLSVVVVDVLPNGTLVIEGRRRVVMDKEQKTIRIAGLVRPLDIQTDNTVVSNRVANASVAYEGDGPLTTATNRGWLSELLDFVWPF